MYDVLPYFWKNIKLKMKQLMGQMFIGRIVMIEFVYRYNQVCIIYDGSL